MLTPRMYCKINVKGSQQETLNHVIYIYKISVLSRSCTPNIHATERERERERETEEREIISEGLLNKNICLAPMTFDPKGIFLVPHLL